MVLSKEEMEILQKEIIAEVKHTHPAFKRNAQNHLNITKENFEKKADALLEKANIDTVPDAYAYLAKLLGLLGDAHTNVFWPGCKIPLFKRIGEKIYLVGLPASLPKEERDNYWLKEVKSIDRVDIETVLKRAKSLIPGETEEWKEYAALRNLSHPYFAKAIGLAKENSLAVELEKGGIVIDYASLYGGNMQNPSIAWVATPEVLRMPDEFGLSLDESGILTIVYPHSWPSVEAVRKVMIKHKVKKDKQLTKLDMERLEVTKKYWKEFLPKIRANAKNAKGVIVDLRGNTGGSSTGFDYIVSIIKDKDLPGCALVDNGVFSAGIWAAFALKKIGYPIVGEAMAQPAARYGENTQETCIKFGGRRIGYGISQSYFDLNAEFDLPKQTRDPDIAVSHDIKSLIKGEDKMLSKAKQVCQKLIDKRNNIK
ncbi:MAG: hypothetical protein IKQ31_04965 [Clostridia bacterium]|nr:hypothetical protein [Clostridia bacterium]